MKRTQQVDSRIQVKMCEAGFGFALWLPDLRIDHHLIMALIERWRPETHTFHFPYGEATIILEDVALHLSLPIEGAPVTGKDTLDWNNLCTRLLGVDLPQKSKGTPGTVSLAWLEKTYSQLSSNSSDEVITQYARARILLMLGGVLLPDTSGTRVHLMYL